MSEKKSKVNKFYKFVYELFTYESVLGTAAVVATGSVVVFGLTPLTLVGAVTAPVVAGVVAYRYGL